MKKKIIILYPTNIYSVDIKINSDSDNDLEKSRAPFEQIINKSRTGMQKAETFPPTVFLQVQCSTNIMRDSLDSLVP